MSAACVVLAAGAGRRFGGPKAEALTASGERFLDVVVRSAIDAGADPVIAIVPPGVSVPDGARAVVGNSASEQISSLRLGLARLANTSVGGTLVWPVDHPFATSQSARHVIDRALETRAPIAVPVYRQRRGHPGWFGRDTWRELMTVADGGARTVIHAYGDAVLEITVNDAGVIKDVNTRDDLARE